MLRSSRLVLTALKAVNASPAERYRRQKFGTQLEDELSKSEENVECKNINEAGLYTVKTSENRIKNETEEKEIKGNEQTITDGERETDGQRAKTEVRNERKGLKEKDSKLEIDFNDSKMDFRTKKLFPKAEEMEENEELKKKTIKEAWPKVTTVKRGKKTVTTIEFQPTKVKEETEQEQQQQQKTQLKEQQQREHQRYQKIEQQQLKQQRQQQTHENLQEQQLKPQQQQKQEQPKQEQPKPQQQQNKQQHQQRNKLGKEWMLSWAKR